MITGARSSVFFHAEHRQIPWLREKDPDPYVEIHPETAKKYNIYDGEWVFIKNDMGRVKRKAKITLTVKPGHIQTLHGWWMPEMKGTEPELFGVWDYQINQLVPGPQASSSGFGGGQYKTTLVTLEKMTEGGE
jgi:anaerobic selenocysteine-containing dehydrogenase